MIASILSRAPQSDLASDLAAGITVAIRIEPGAGHAFFRNGGAWPRTLDWFSRYL